MSGHTKAPWAIAQFGTTDKWAIGPDVSTRVCDAYGIDNARLIASAPELLAALKWMVGVSWGLDPATTADGCYTDDPMEIAARAAIAKAEGQA